MQGHSLTQLLGLATATALVTAVIVIYQLRTQDTQARRADIPWRQEALGQLEQDLKKQGKALKRIEKSLNKQEKFLKALDADEKALNKELKARNNKQNETQSARLPASQFSCVKGSYYATSIFELYFE